MLKALYDYGLTHNETPVGFRRKAISGYIVLDSNGAFEGVELAPDKNTKTPVPDLGSLVLTPACCNILAEKRGIILGEGKNDIKSQYFLNAMELVGQTVHEAKLCANALKDSNTLAEITAECDSAKITSQMPLAFKVDGKVLNELPSVKVWWDKNKNNEIFITQNKKSINNSQNKPLVRDIITGELIDDPMLICPTMSGLSVVGGAGTGDRLLCFDKAPFQSYGFQKMQNAAMSESTICTIVSAFESLVEKAPILAGVKYVHWYDRDIRPEDDLLESIFLNALDTKKKKKKTDEEDVENVETPEQKANQLIRKVENGEYAPVPLDAMYHIIKVNAMSGRVRIHRYEVGRYEDLRRNIQLWNEDLALDSIQNGEYVAPKPLRTRFIRLLNTTKNINDALKASFEAQSMNVVDAIIKGTQIPDYLATQSLLLIAKEVVSGDSDIPSDILCQWLKVWVNRKERAKEREGKEGTYLSPGLNPNLESNAYQCGRMMAVFAELQGAAIKNVKAGVVQRFYGKTYTNPGLVFPQLQSMSQHHLSKLVRMNKKGLSFYFESMLNEISTHITEIPQRLTREEQAMFALGYRHQMVELVRNKQKKKAEKEKKAKTEVKKRTKKSA